MDNEAWQKIAREAANKMMVNFGGQTFTREYAVMSEEIILAAIERADPDFSRVQELAGKHLELQLAIMNAPSLEKGGLATQEQLLEKVKQLHAAQPTAVERAENARNKAVVDAIAPAQPSKAAPLGERSEPRICECGHNEVQHMRFSDHDECTGEECECDRFRAITSDQPRPSGQEEEWVCGTCGASATKPDGRPSGQEWWNDDAYIYCGKTAMGSGRTFIGRAHDTKDAKAISSAHNVKLAAMKRRPSGQEEWTQATVQKLIDGKENWRTVIADAHNAALVAERKLWKNDPGLKYAETVKQLRQQLLQAQAAIAEVLKGARYQVQYNSYWEPEPLIERLRSIDDTALREHDAEVREKAYLQGFNDASSKIYENPTEAQKQHDAEIRKPLVELLQRARKITESKPKHYWIGSTEIVRKWEADADDALAKME